MESLRDAQPGDILQFEDVVLVSKHVEDDGAIVRTTRKMAHHTAIIAEVRKRGAKPVLVILHQNVNNSPIVEQWTIDLADKKRGTVKAYRPVAVAREP